MNVSSKRRFDVPAWCSIALATLVLHGCVLDAVWPGATGDVAVRQPVRVRTIAATGEADVAEEPVVLSPVPLPETVLPPTREAVRPRHATASSNNATALRRPTPIVRGDASDERAPPTLLLVAAVSDAPPAPDAPRSVGAASTQPTVPDSVPTYRTAPPPATHLFYDLRHGMLGGQGDIDWAPNGPKYTLTLEGRIASLTLLTQVSTGGFDAHGLAPERYTDQRMKRAVNAANLQRDAAKITFSGPSTEYPLLPGTQDRVSWMVQLAAVINAQPELAKVGAKVTLFVVGARGEGDVWVFVCTGSETVETGMGPMRADKFIREPSKPNDTQVEAWLAPQLHGLPAHARLSNGNDGALDLILRRVD